MLRSVFFSYAEYVHYLSNAWKQLNVRFKDSKISGFQGYKVSGSQDFQGSKF